MTTMDIQKIISHSFVGKITALPTTSPPRHKKGEKFLKGPIPWDWLCLAAQQKGRSLHVAIALWFLAGMNKKRTVALTNTVLQGLGINRFTKSRALRTLERAQLITISSHKGRNPVVTITEVIR